MGRLATAAVLLVTTAGLGGAQFDLEKSREARAELTTRGLLQACEAYYLNPQSENKYPEKLDQLAMPPFGGRPYIPDAKHLTDPWGKEYYYRVVSNAKGDARPYVWSERVVGGKTKVIGTKPPEEKKK